MQTAYPAQSECPHFHTPLSDFWNPVLLFLLPESAVVYMTMGAIQSRPVWRSEILRGLRKLPMEKKRYKRV